MHLRGSQEEDAVTLRQGDVSLLAEENSAPRASWSVSCYLPWTLQSRDIKRTRPFPEISYKLVASSSLSGLSYLCLEN